MQLRPLSAVVAATQTYSRGRKERAGGGGYAYQRQAFQNIFVVHHLLGSSYWLFKKSYAYHWRIVEYP